MSIIDLFSMSVRNMFKRKLRTFLTVFAVVIGTTAIILLLSFGIAVNQNFQSMLDDMGDITTIKVYPPASGNSSSESMMKMAGSGSISFSAGGSSKNNDSKILLDDKAIDVFKLVPNVIAVSPIISSYIEGMSGKYTTYLSLKGIDPSSMASFGYKLSEGTFFTGTDKFEVVFGSQAMQNFYNPKSSHFGGSSSEPLVNVMTDRIKVTVDYNYIYNKDNPDVKLSNFKPFDIKVKGILESNGYEQDYDVFMDIKDVQRIKADKAKFEQSQEWGYSGGKNTKVSTAYDYVMIKCSNIDSVKKIQEHIEGLGYYVDSAMQYLEPMKEMSSSLQVFLGLIGGVSLFIAAIGIANTMIMAIYERTKEIGIMKVIGATIQDIKRLFLLESSLIGFLGGGIGVLISLALSKVLNSSNIPFLQSMVGEGGGALSVIPVWLSVLALIFSASIGLISGYFPARRAMKLGALEAIKTE